MHLHIIHPKVYWIFWKPSYKGFKNEPKTPQLIYNGGWHFSFLKTPENIAKKIKAYSHQEFNQEKYTDIKNIEEKINNNQDIFDRNYDYKRISLDGEFPDYIVNNKEQGFALVVSLLLLIIIPCSSLK